MRFGGAIALWTLFLILSSGIAFANVDGKWDSGENSCNCNVRLVIGMYEDGSPTGTMSFAGTQSAIYNIVVDGDHISFSVDQPDNNKTVTYDYDAKVSGDSMTGTCTNEEGPSETMPFSAKRHRGD